ncbi:hypothetical protein F5884DRAFT_770605 [Xylogone sp. PMI_703]|nr:hypothetical protein F5884DRAFT_770605 [Xylogone sp. PMI_703]
MSSSNHPLPPPPGGQPRPHQRERSKSSFSFKSNHSHKSSGSFGKVDLHETHEEKEARRLHTKADPSIAIMEAEPAIIQANEKNLLGSLRAMQHKDLQGNPIVEPDRSNPTRSRWERPLDTIRSFEAAIDGNYRKSYSRADSSEPNWNRRGSYYAGGANEDRPRNSQSGYYGNRSQSYRDSYNGNGNGAAGRPDSYYYNNGQENNGNAYQNQNRSRYPRTTSEPYSNGQGVYPVTGNQQSYETVTTATGSGSSGEPAGYTTDPSSENSSVDRVQPIQNKQPADNYGFEGFGGNPQLQPVGAGINSNNPYNGNNHYGQYNQPSQGGSVLRKQAPGGPIKLGGAANGNGPSVYEPPRPEPEKRKSFFKRFSKSS